MPSFAYLECHCSLFRRVRSKTCPWSVATLLSIVSSALEAIDIHNVVQYQHLTCALTLLAALRFPPNILWFSLLVI